MGGSSLYKPEDLVWSHDGSFNHSSLQGWDYWCYHFGVGLTGLFFVVGFVAVVAGIFYIFFTLSEIRRHMKNCRKSHKEPRRKA